MTDYTKLTIEELEAEQSALEKALEGKKGVRDCERFRDAVTAFYDGVERTTPMSDSDKCTVRGLVRAFPAMKAVMEPDSAGWIEWNGTLVEVRFRDGEKAKNIRSEGWFWKHDGEHYEIVSYRVINE